MELDFIEKFVTALRTFSQTRAEELKPGHELFSSTPMDLVASAPKQWGYLPAN